MALLRNNFLRIFLLTAIFTAGIFLGRAVYAGPGAGGLGTEVDPLVAKSYLEQEVYNFNQKTLQQIQNLQLQLNGLKMDLELIEKAL